MYTKAPSRRLAGRRLLVYSRTIPMPLSPTVTKTFMMQPCLQGGFPQQPAQQRVTAALSLFLLLP
jgi:hypothetical protein